MRLIDADAVPIIGVSDYSVMLQKTLDAQPTIDLWHYPSKGEYPTEKELVLMKIPGCYVLGWYYKKNWFMDDGELSILNCTVSRWQYIVPPKEEI